MNDEMKFLYERTLAEDSLPPEMAAMLSALIGIEASNEKLESPQQGRSHSIQRGNKQAGQFIGLTQGDPDNEE